MAKWVARRVQLATMKRGDQEVGGSSLGSGIWPGTSRVSFFYPKQISTMVFLIRTYFTKE